MEDIKFGCHCDLAEYMEPDGCVLDEDRPQDCVYARILVAKHQTKHQCAYWKPIQEKQQ